MTNHMMDKENVLEFLNERIDRAEEEHEYFPDEDPRSGFWYGKANEARIIRNRILEWEEDE